MRKSKSIYPIGATWEYSDDNMRGSVWLAEISYGHEIWRWSFCYSDGSGSKADYSYNRRSAIEECAAKFRKKVRFKRLKTAINNAKQINK